ncbi:MAG: GIY-YIG nuclease family protein [Candidatus Dojkabacteria bacterium]|nr:GIY-YIG nuclease family protein [Candidatus Dojkabacteria bacterium]
MESNELKTHINCDINIKSVIDNISPEDIYLTPISCGAYVITFSSEEKYVGSAKSIRSRLYHHHKNFDDKYQIKFICIYLTENDFDARLLEKILIKDIKPKINKRDLFPGSGQHVMEIPDKVHKKLKVTSNILYEKYDIKMSLMEIMCSDLLCKRPNLNTDEFIDAFNPENEANNIYEQQKKRHQTSQ